LVPTTLPATLPVVEATSTCDLDERVASRDRDTANAIEFVTSWPPPELRRAARFR
jgi:hypothetical protein